MPGLYRFVNIEEPGWSFCFLSIVVASVFVVLMWPVWPSVVRAQVFGVVWFVAMVGVSLKERQLFSVG